jgi:hypothetical protein
VIDAFLRQPVEELTPPEQSWSMLHQIVSAP